MDLFDSDSNDDEVSFKINEGYAKNYEKWRKKEEKQKLLDRYGEQDTTDSSSEEEEIRSTPQMDKDWLRAYAVVRFKQPRLYKDGERFFKDTAKPVSKKKEKAVTLKDHERNFILEKGGVASDEETEKPKKSIGMSYFEEQDEIKKDLKNAIGDSSDSESIEGEDLLYKAHKTEEQKQQEDNEYLEWLKGERESLGDPDAEAELAPLKQYWSDPNISEKERVLRDYILNNGYMDQEDSDSDSDEDTNLQEGPDPKEEEEFLEKADKYEHKYNFRHEEPGGDEIKSYPRVIETSVRTKDTRRAEKRKEKLEKKRKEKEKMKDEIRLLQKLQMEEKMEKLEKLRQIAHRPDLDYDLDADFDPEKHNEIMKKYFDDDYYDEDAADQKPTFEYDATIDEEEDDWWKERLQEEIEEADDVENQETNNGTSGTSQNQEEEDLDDDNPNFIMDADYDPSRDYKAEKKRAKKYGKTFAKKLPIFDPSTKTFDEYIDEYLKDKINDLPFTYRKVTPNDYGLTTEEILSLPDRELNAWVSVKKMSQYRTPREEAEERRRYHSRAKDLEKKKKILPSLFAKQEENPEAKSKKKKKKRKRKSDEIDSETDQQESEPSDSQTQQNEKHTPPTKKLKSSPAKEDTITLSRLGNPAKKVKKNLTSDNAKHTYPNHDLETKQISEYNHTEYEDFNVPESSQPKEKQKKAKALKLSKNNKIEKSGQNDQTQSKSKDVNIHLSKKKKDKSQDKPPDKMEKLVTFEVEASMEDRKNAGLSRKKKKVKNADKQTKKKKKLSINMNKKSPGDEFQKGQDNKDLERQLSKIMSVSRLSKYGLGPNAKNTKKKKKKQS